MFLNLAITSTKPHDGDRSSGWMFYESGPKFDSYKKNEMNRNGERLFIY
jgi:hypothetical protein